MTDPITLRRILMLEQQVEKLGTTLIAVLGPPPGAIRILDARTERLQASVARLQVLAEKLDARTCALADVTRTLVDLTTNADRVEAHKLRDRIDELEEQLSDMAYEARDAEDRAEADRE